MRIAVVGALLLLVSGCLGYVGDDEDPEPVPAATGQCRTHARNAAEPVLLVYAYWVNAARVSQGPATGAEVNVTFGTEAKPYQTVRVGADGCAVFRLGAEGEYEVAASHGEPPCRTLSLQRFQHDDRRHVEIDLAITRIC